MFNYFEEFDTQNKVFDAKVTWRDFELNIDESVYIDLKKETVEEQNTGLSKNVDDAIHRALETSKISLRQSAPKRDMKRLSHAPIFSALELICVTDQRDGKSSHVMDFDFIPSYDENEVVPAIKGRLERKVGERILGSLLGGSCLPVNINYLNSEPQFFNVISLSQEKLISLIATEVQEEGSQRRDTGHLIAKISSNIARIGIDRPYGGQKYLDDNFQVIQNFDEAEYVVFTDVSAGNVLLSVYGTFGETELVAHVFLNEITFENIELQRLDNFQVNIFKKDLLATTPLEIDLPEDKIWAFNHPREHATKLSNSMYELKNVTYPVGSRRYLEVLYLDDTLMVGLDRSKIIEIPSHTLYKMILDETGVTSLKRSCVIQLNLREPCNELKAKAYSEISQEGIDTYYLDSDGKISNELSELTEKIFLIGNFSGVVDFSMENYRKERMIFRTFCAENVYLVEQL